MNFTTDAELIIVARDLSMMHEIVELTEQNIRLFPRQDVVVILC